MGTYSDDDRRVSLEKLSRDVDEALDQQPAITPHVDGPVAPQYAAAEYATEYPTAEYTATAYAPEYATTEYAADEYTDAGYGAAEYAAPDYPSVPVAAYAPAPAPTGRTGDRLTGRPRIHPRVRASTRPGHRDRDDRRREDPHDHSADGDHDGHDRRGDTDGRMRADRQ